MNMRNITLAGIILLVLAFTLSTGTAQPDNQGSKNANDEIPPYEGLIGPDSALYGLKIALENLDEGLTFNASKKLEKKIAHLNTRISEAEASLRKNNTKAAQIALEHFVEKNEEADNAISGFSGADSGLEHAFEMIKKHQNVLENLNILHPDNKGLARAYENSKRLEQKFAAKHGLTREKGEEEENIKIKAETFGNSTEVEVSLKFKSNNLTNFTLAPEILGKFQLSTENINSLLTVENVDKGELKPELETEAEINDGFSNVEADYKFPLNVTNRTEIIEGVYLQLQNLTTQDILNVLEIKEEGIEKKGSKAVRREDREEEKGKNDVEKAVRRQDKEERKQERKD